MKKRLLSALLACLLLLIGAALADGAETAALAAGQIGVFSDCVVTVNEIAWYGDVQSNLLIAASNGTPTVLAIRAQVLNRGMDSRDFAQDSGLFVRYGDAYNQAGEVAEEAFAGGNGLYFIRSSSILVSPLQSKNIVAYVRVSPLMYYSASQLDVQLTIGGHVMRISLNSAAQGQSGASIAPPTAGPTQAPAYTGPIVVNPPSSYGQTAAQPTAAPQTSGRKLQVLVAPMDENKSIIMNPTYLEVPFGGIAYLTPQEIPGYTYDHYSFLKDGQWQDAYGAGITVYADAAGNLDKQQIFLIYRKGQAAPTQAPAYSSAQIVRPTAWDTQFRPGISTAPDGRGDNANVYLQLKNLYDDNPNTSIAWLLYVSERTDGIPEFTASFNNASISAIGVRNGKATSEKEFFANARLASLHLRIHTTSGEVLNTWVYLPDEYSPDYQILPLEKTYRNVASVELWIEGNVNQGFYMGTGETSYVIHITDIQFYYGSPSTASPTADPWSGASY